MTTSIEPLREDFWKSRRVFVTGSTGFLGGWLIRELIQRGARVVALVRREKPESQFYLDSQHQQVDVVSGTVWDRNLLETTIEQHEIDTIFHTTMAGGDVSATVEYAGGMFPLDGGEYSVDAGRAAA